MEAVVSALVDARAWLLPRNLRGDGSTELVGLTVCEVDRYEKKNKATCEPFGG